MTKFLVVGNALVDVVACIHSPTTIEIDSKTVEKILCINFASKTELEDLRVKFGGSAANTAVTLCALGSQTELATAVGNDDFGRMVLQDLGKAKVGTKYCEKLPGKRTGMSVVLLAGGEKSVLTFHGAFSSLSPKHLNKQAIEQADVIIFTSLSSPENFQYFLKAVGLCRKLGKKMVFAPSITMLRARADEFRKFHEHFDVVIMNREEAALYTGKTDAQTALRALPGKVRVITDGANGAFLHFGGESFHINTAARKVVDSTGAGDAFTGAFCQQYYSHGDAKRALATASAVAALKLSTLGAHFKNTTADVEKFKKKNAATLKISKR